MSFQCEIVTTRNGFEELQGKWNKLLNKSPGNTIFLTWEWQSIWWNVFGGELYIITVIIPESNELIAILPFVMKHRLVFSDKFTDFSVFSSDPGPMQRSGAVIQFLRSADSATGKSC